MIFFYLNFLCLRILCTCSFSILFCMPDHYRQARTNSSSSVTTSNVVGVHYKVGRKIGEGSFGIIYEGK